jgi:undecaprenyl-diphosphatase
VLERLAHLDAAWFHWINTGHRNPLFDALMPFVTGAANWSIPILVSWTALLLFGGRRGRTAALLLVPLLVLSDQTSSHLLKHTFERVRPCGALPDVHLLVGCSSSSSMPSSHAANFGAAAFHLSMFYPGAAPWLLGLAFLVGYSRVYVGVHYPLDTVVGFGVGLAAALVIRGLYRFGSRQAQSREVGSRLRRIRTRRAGTTDPR